MNRNLSANDLRRSVGRSPQRVAYMNLETAKKDLSTPFHSPYKDGRPNPNFQNPSFVSSHLFYQQQGCHDDLQSRVNLTQNVIPNRNDIRREELVQQRIRKQQSRSPLGGRQKGAKEREFAGKAGKMRILRANQPQNLLRNQLQNLQNYRQSYQQKKERLQEISRYRPQQIVEPIYFQKPLRKDKASAQAATKEQTAAEQQRQLAEEVRALQKQVGGSSEADKMNVTRLVEHNRTLLQREEEQYRRQSNLLGTILREQMRSRQALGDRRWNY